MEQRRDRPDSELRGQVLVFVDVHLGDLEFAGLFPGEFVEHGRDRAARAAPLRPEVDQHGEGGLEDLGFPVVGGDGDGVLGHDGASRG